ncbi:MAG: PAS domain S-box protein, partial [Leptolyngbyaceae bacterium]|nr:PAS domain S-box protein [Leptolyngbyaceae bacterium]
MSDLDGQESLPSVLDDTSMSEDKQFEQSLLLTQYSVDNCADIVYWIAPDGQFLYVNYATCKTLGYNMAALLEMHIADIEPEITTEYWQAHFNELKQSKATMTFETLLRCANGSRLPVEITTRYLEFNGKEYLCSFCRDISERRAALLARQKAEEQLRQSEERWQLALRGNNDGIWDWNCQTHDCFFSPRWKEMLGYEDHELPNQLDTWTSRIHPEDWDLVMAIQKEHLDQKTPFYRVEYRLRCKDGSYKWILSRAQGLWDEQGTPLRLVGSHTDITERKRDEAERKHREEALRLIMEGTASTTGNQFFQCCVRSLAQVLKVRYALVTQFANPSKTRVRTLAFWAGDTFSEATEYDLANTPCQAVLKGTTCYYPRNVQHHFPDDSELAELGAQGYLGIPLIDSDGDILGHLAVLDNQPLEDTSTITLILKIFAARAGAELERQL